ncbi:hypothetical protein PA25_01660 [Pseudoalteromonas sp. A25]|nr:hypothetical protein PA25_01660 [Pseudoalteromonas sp. A25]
MSTVFLATDAKLGRKVALKVLNNGKTHSQTLMEEARLLARLNHPNIVQVYNVQEIDDCLVLEMEYVQGTTLANHVKEAHLSLEQKLSILIDIAQGLTAAHQQDILHLDLKAANVLINKQGQAKIADFGISQLKGEQELSALSSFGSLVSMSPEQLREEPLDQRSDLFSFGLLAYQLLTGNHPYRGQAKSNNEQAIAEQIKFSPLQHAARGLIELPSALITLIERLLQFDKDLRPHSAEEVVMHLKQVLMGVTYDNSDPTVELSELNLSNPNSKRNKLLTLFAFAFAFLFIGLLGSGIWYWQINKPKTYIAALPIKYDENSSLTDTQQRIVKLGLDDAISNFILQDSSTLQVSNSEVESAIKLMGEQTSLASLGKALGANILLEPELSCRGPICEVVLNAIDGSNATMIKSTRYSVDADLFSETYRNSLSHISGLFSKKHDLNEMDDAFFDKYVELVNAYNTGSQDLLTTLRKVQLLLKQSPSFTPLYSFYRRVVIETDRAHSDKSVLWDFLSDLENAPKNYKGSQNYTLDHILVYQSLNNWKEADNLIKGLENSSFIDAYELYSIKASYHRERAQYKEALLNMVEAHRLRPTLYTTRNLAITHLLNGDYPSALTFLDLVINSAPNDYWALQAYADISLLNDSPVKAIKAYRQLLKKTPNDSKTLTNLSIALALIGDYEQSSKNAYKAYTLSSNNVSYILNYADSLIYKGEETQAKHLYQKIINLTNDSDNSDILLVRAQALLHSGQQVVALRLINELELEHPSNYDLKFVKAMVLTILGESQSALLAIEASINEGWSKSFFALPWFKKLCSHKPTLIQLIGLDNVNILCKPAPAFT